MKINLDGQVALVTGAGRGIGQGIARMLGANGARVICADRDIKTATESAAKISRASPLLMDITNAEQVEAGVAQIEKECGRLDILVNNAGIGTAGEFRVNVDQFSISEWERILNVDLTGTFLVSRFSSQVMIRRKYGRIINIASVMGVVPARLQCAYTAAKAGVVHLSKTMAIELAPSNILVNCIGPGTMENVYVEGSVLNSARDRILSHVPLGRPGTFEDIAHAVTFFAAPENSYITGQTLCVDGGWTAGGFFRDF
jgi:NAD(P)-dependent dehydrogenase (short-subunit alcohol dehydrogenase family)